MSWRNSAKRTLCATLHGLLIVMFLNGCAAQQQTKEANLREIEEGAVSIEEQWGIEAQQQTKEANLREIEERVISIEEQWGIEVQEIRLSAAGYMLDFRYKVVDPDKAVPILRRPVESYVVDQSSGRKLLVPRPPKVGSLRQTTLKPEAGRIYFTIFANPGKFVKPGNKITVAIGDMQIEDLVVN